MPKEELNPFKNTPESRKLKGKLLTKILLEKGEQNCGNYSYIEEVLLKRAASK